MEKKLNIMIALLVVAVLLLGFSIFSLYQRPMLTNTKAFSIPNIDATQLCEGLGGRLFVTDMGDGSTTFFKCVR